MALPQSSGRFDAPRLADVDSLYIAVIESTSQYTGEEFLYEVVGAIARSLDASTVYVAELLVDMERAHSVAGFHNGEHTPPTDFDLNGHSPAAEAVARGRSIYEQDLRQRFPDNSWFEGNRSEASINLLVRSRSGDPLGLLGVLNDARFDDLAGAVALLERLLPRIGAELERRQRDIALRRSEARFRLLIEHSKDIMFYYRVKPDEAFEYISPAVNDMVGWPPEAYFANPQLAIEVLDYDYRPLVLRAIATGSEEPIVAKMLLPESRAGWVEYRNFAFRNDEDSIIAIGGTIRDVTDRIRAEEELARSERYRRALLEAAPDTIFRLDIEGAILDYVPGEALTEVMTGRHGEQQQSIGDLLPLAYVAPAKRLIQDAVRGGQLQRFEFETTQAGESQTFEVRCIPFGEREVLMVVRDFTAMKWHAGEADRMRLRDELDVKVEGKMRVRNPYGLTYRELAVLHLVAEGSADKQIAEALGISIYTANKHVGNILGKMNAASRTEAGVRALREGLLG